MKTSLTLVVPLMLAALLLPVYASAQVNSGSDGHDGALNPTANLVIDMADHPDGIYHYTSVNIPAGVTVSFIPNANNSPVTWLVRSNVVINGTVDVSGQSPNGVIGGTGGPGGWAGGSGGNNPSPGQGPGGGGTGRGGAGGGFGTQGQIGGDGPELLGRVYGNSFLIPLIGGSGGGGGFGSIGLPSAGGGGGGGAILIAASGSVTINGVLLAIGGGNPSTGVGSGGAIRLITATLIGNGSINALGGTAPANGRIGGSGRIRIDAFQNNFGGQINGEFTQGFQPIIIPVAGQGVQLSIASVAGITVAANPSGVLVNPDVIIPGQQNNPIPVVIHSTNIPLNTEISVVVHPANGPDVHAVGINNVGTTASSTTTVSLNMPRGGGIIYAKAVTGIAGIVSTSNGADANTRSLAETGWTAEGERFVAMEIRASLGGKQSITYLTKSGKRYPFN